MTEGAGHHHHHGPPGDLTSVESHLADILGTVQPLPPTHLAIPEAEGCVLAEDITASVPLPPFDNSAMDGYALISADVTEASKDTPVMLRVSGEVAAGDTGAYAVTPGTCLRITTGAKLPGGADAVVPVEDTDGGLAQVAIKIPAAPGDSVRYSGGDARQGDVLLPAGTRLGPMQIAVLAASGRARAEVYPRPRVVVLSTGDELTAPGTPLAPGKIWDSNSYTLTAAAHEAGCLAYRYGPIPDDPMEMLPAIEDQLLRADLIVTSGGVSMGGEHDVVKETLSRLGTVKFRKVALQPGMPQGFGTIGEDETPIFTLPGNPVSAYVSFILFVQPALDALKNYSPQRQPLADAALTMSVRSPGGRRSYLRGILDPARETVVPLTGQSSHQLGALAQANALIIVPEDVTRLEAGDGVHVMCLP